MTVDAFWDWSLGAYAHDPLQQHLLELQRVGDLVILEALFACWLATHGVCLTTDAANHLSDMTRSWLDEVVVPLRGTRERWKSVPELQSQRAHLLQLEVEAERHLAELMWTSVSETLGLREHTAHRSASDGAEVMMNENLALLSSFRNGEYAPERLQLVALLVQAT
jgi:uncharacterized protein (TIGR02444 family)